MKSVAYPIILEKEADGYFVTVPDIDRYTQGEDIADAMEMARDLICLWLLDLEESGKSIPQPASMELNVSKDAIVTFVDVNLDEYRKKYGTRVVKKNCTIPAWLNARAEAIGVNFSQTLQEALLAKMGKKMEDIQTINFAEYKRQQYDILADSIRENLDMKQIYEILEAGV